MKKLIGLALYGITLFGISAGLGWYLQQQTLDAAALAAAEELQMAAEADALEKTEMAKVKPVDAFGDPAIEQPLNDDGQMPVAVRPPPMSVEEIVRYGLGLKERDQAILEREEALQIQERRQNLVKVDIEGARKEIEGLLIQSRDQRAAAEQLLNQVVAEQQRIEASKKNTAETPTVGAAASPPSGVLPNLKGGSEIFAGMEPEKAAAILTSYCNDGHLETVVQYLDQMDSRQQIKVIQAIQDEQLMGEIISGITALKPVQKTATRR